MPIRNAFERHYDAAYEIRLRIFKAYKHWDQEVISVVRVKFPNVLTDKEINTDGMLPLALTGSQAMNRIEGKTARIIDALWSSL